MKSIRFVFGMNENIELSGSDNFDEILKKLRKAEEGGMDVVSFTHHPGKDSFVGAKEYHLNMHALQYWVYEDDSKS